jgi:hypothetical protein
LVDDYLEVYEGLCDAKKVIHQVSLSFIMHAPNCRFLIHSLKSNILLREAKNSGAIALVVGYVDLIYLHSFSSVFVFLLIIF